MVKKTENEKKFNVMITGVTSTVGRSLALDLYKDSRIGIILGTAREDKPYYFKSLDSSRFIYQKTNILKSRELKDLFRSAVFKDSHIDTMIHMAFLNRPTHQGKVIHSLNVEGTKKLLEECIECQCIKKFIFKSSDIVYKLLPHNPIYLDENADLNFDPDADQWIKDRVDAEMICRSFMDHRDINIVILRFTSIIGRNIHSQLNAYFDAALQFRAAGFNPQINLIHMSDVIQALRQSIFKDVSGIFNIAGLDTAPITTLAELNRSTLIPVPSSLIGPMNWIMRKMGITDYYYSVDADRMKYTCLLDIQKARQVLGFQPERHIVFREE